MVDDGWSNLDVSLLEEGVVAVGGGPGDLDRLLGTVAPEPLIQHDAGVVVGGSCGGWWQLWWLVAVVVVGGSCGGLKVVMSASVAMTL